MKGTLRGLKEKVDALDMDEVSRRSFVGKMDILADLNRDQLLEGKNAMGGSLPKYIDDPYFKSREAAQRYSDWKDSISPVTGRPRGVMNLYIIGTYHNSIKAILRGDVIKFESTFYAANEIEREVPGVYGLGGRFRKTFLDETIRPSFTKILEQEIGIKISK